MWVAGGHQVWLRAVRRPLFERPIGAKGRVSIVDGGNARCRPRPLTASSGLYGRGRGAPDREFHRLATHGNL